METVPSVLRRCWLGGRKGIRPVKKLRGGVLAWLSVWRRDADLREAQQMLLPLTVSCCSKLQTGFTFLVPAHPGSPGQRAIKRVCVCVYGDSADDAVENSSVFSLIRMHW